METKYLVIWSNPILDNTRNNQENQFWKKIRLAIIIIMPKSIPNLASQFRI